MTLSPEDLDSLSANSEKLVGSLEDLAWSYIVQALAKHSEGKSNLEPDDWRQELLKHADEVAKAITAAGAQPFTTIAKQLDGTVKHVPVQQQRLAESWLSSLAKKGAFDAPKSLEESHAVNKIVMAARQSSSHYLGLAQRGMSKEGKRVFSSIVSDAALAIKNGKTPNEGLAEASRRWSAQGVPALTDKAGRRWQPDTYLRMVVQTQVKQTTNEVMIQRTKETSGLVKVSSHAACRPTHLPYQGQVYSVSGETADYPDLYEATSFGSAGGLCGINCHHYVMTYVPSYDTPDIDTLDPASNNERYQLTQKQRKLERDVRASKRQLEAAQQFGSDADIDRAKRLVTSQQRGLGAFVNAHTDMLRRDYSREKILSSTTQEAERSAKRTLFTSNLKAMHSKNLRQALEADPDIGDIAKPVQSVATQMLRHRSGTLQEDLALLDRRTGETKYLFDSSISNDAVDHYPAAMKALMAESPRNSLAVIHSHPRSVPPSSNDLVALQRSHNNSTAYGIIAGHDGTMFVYTKATKPLPSPNKLDLQVQVIANKQLTGSKTDRWIKALNEVGEEYGFQVRKIRSH